MAIEVIAPDAREIRAFDATSYTVHADGGLDVALTDGSVSPSLRRNGPTCGVAEVSHIAWLGGGYRLGSACPGQRPGPARLGHPVDTQRMGGLGATIQAT